MEEGILGALLYWGIGDEGGESVTWRQPYVDDDPRITLGTLEQDLQGKRVALLSSHGGPQHAPALMAELYETPQARQARYSEYLNSGHYDTWEIALTPDPLEDPNGVAYPIMLLEAGIHGHLRTMEEDAIVY